eukprot:7563896-Lingulodinium_polyedra.AAC.1
MTWPATDYLQQCTKSCMNMDANTVKSTNCLEPLIDVHANAIVLAHKLCFLDSLIVGDQPFGACLSGLNGQACLQP